LKILFDTNIILDVFLNRKPFEETAIRLFSAVENNIIQGYLCSTTITTLDYLLNKSIGRDNSKHAIVSVLDMFNITEVNYRTLKAAVDSDFSDFEDAVLYFSGYDASVDGIVTRNTNDFTAAQLPIYKPDDLWALIKSAPTFKL
jgi:predicted nucleic acid-binding protein